MSGLLAGKSLYRDVEIEIFLLYLTQYVAVKSLAVMDEGKDDMLSGYGACMHLARLRSGELKMSHGCH